MEYLQGRMSDSQVFLVKQHKKKMIGGGSSLLRALLLGPLAKAGGFGFRWAGGIRRDGQCRGHGTGRTRLRTHGGVICGLSF